MRQIHTIDGLNVLLAYIAHIAPDMFPSGPLGSGETITLETIFRELNSGITNVFPKEKHADFRVNLASLAEKALRAYQFKASDQAVYFLQEIQTEITKIDLLS